MPQIVKYLIVYALSAFKIIFGPTLGQAYGFSILETVLLSVAGMMTTVYLLSYFGPEIRSFFKRIFGSSKPKKKFTKKTRNFIRIWQRYGVPGVAFFTPILLSPPGGTILATAFGGKRKEIIKWMWIFGSVWSVILTLLVKYASHLLHDLGVL